MPNFPGRRDPAGDVLRCRDCGDIATHKGAGLVNNHRVLYSYCEVDGFHAQKNRVVNSLEEIADYRTWKKKAIAESVASHPSTFVPTSSHLRLFEEQ